MVRLAAALSFLLAVSLPAQTLPELFQKAKAQVKSESWQEALATLDQLDVESAKPGNEAARQQLEAPMAFYRGVCEANLGHAEKAESDFAVFLQEKPGATIDNATYSKKAVRPSRPRRTPPSRPRARTSPSRRRTRERHRTALPRFSRNSRGSSLRPTWARNRTIGGPTDR